MIHFRNDPAQGYTGRRNVRRDRLRSHTHHCAVYLAAFILIAPASVRAEWFTQVYGTHVLAAQAEGTAQPDPQVPESSGLVSSRTSPDVFWTHNDSGSGPVVWAFRLSAADRAAGTARRLGSVTLTGASAVDWEDMSTGPGPRLYMFDGGDNPPCDLTNKRIHRFIEPTIDPNGAPISQTAAFESIRFEYPDSVNPALPADSNAERYDAECFMVHPVSGDMYVVTKRDTNNASVARVFKLPAASAVWNSATIHVLQYVADITSATGNSQTTGGDIDAFGRRAVVRRYAAAYEFTLPQGQTFDAIFQQTPVQISLSGELQGESVCYDKVGRGGNLISTSEVITSLGPQRLPFYITPWQLANVAAVQIQRNKAMIRWDTADALASTVDYGITTAYGQTVTQPDAVTAHLITLSGLAANTQYYYRVTSGSLVHPQAGGAGGVFFTTRFSISPDFDWDGDVDQTDFAVLQRCFSGPDLMPANPLCNTACLDADTDVDADDVGYFAACAAGPNVAADPGCEP